VFSLSIEGSDLDGAGGSRSCFSGTSSARTTRRRMNDTRTADGLRLRFRLTLESAWPPLAWVAKCERSDPVISVRHGPQVEAREGWFCEAVWDGEFASGGFDQTDLVFGSGSRLRNGRAVFVSSGSTVDRLQFLELGDTIWISNSLACLLGTSGVKVDRTYDRYFDFFWSITRGLNGYERRLPTSTGRLEFAFFRNLIWDGEKLAGEDKPRPVREMGSFPEYRGFLEASLAGIAANMQATERNHRYRMVSGLSSGYDRCWQRRSGSRGCSRFERRGGGSRITERT